MMDEGFTDEDYYVQLADELNDPDVRISCHRCGHLQLVKVQCERCGNDLDPLADFDYHVITPAERYARANDLSWPPQIGDYDRYWDAKHN